MFALILLILPFEALLAGWVAVGMFDDLATFDRPLASWDGFIAAGFCVVTTTTVAAYAGMWWRKRLAWVVALADQAAWVVTGAVFFWHELRRPDQGILGSLEAVGVLIVLVAVGVALCLIS